MKSNLKRAQKYYVLLLISPIVILFVRNEMWLGSTFQIYWSDGTFKKHKEYTSLQLPLFWTCPVHIGL